MGKPGEDVDASPVTMRKKSKKNKNKINELPDVDGDGNSQVETDDALSKEKNGHKHREKKKKKKKNKKEEESNEDGVEDRPDKGDLVDDANFGETKKKRESGSNEDGVNDRHDKGDLVDADFGEKKKKTKKKKRESGPKEDGVEDRPNKSNLVNDVDVSKKDKKKKRKRDSSKETQTEENEENQNDGRELSEKSDNKKRKFDAQNSDTQTKEIMTEESTPERQDDAEDGRGTKERKKTKVKGSKAQNKTTEPVGNDTGKAKAKGKGKSKKVSFSSHVEVFTSSDTAPKNKTTKGDGLIRGKRFTPEEDVIITDAVHNYIKDNDLGEDGLMKVMNCSKHGMKKCWQEIGQCIPYRPYLAVYNRAHILFLRAKTKGFTPEEDEDLKKYHEKYGNNWKKIGELMGKHRTHVKDQWRKIKPENQKEGKWDQEEVQTVYDLVNMDLKMRIHCEKKSKHGMLKDNIPWGAISEKLSTRSDASCCFKWYKLSSSLVAEGLWSEADDYRMIGKLYELDAACVVDVDWDNLLEHRPGDICRKRWDQMVKHIGDYGSKSFAEQVDVLADRYVPDLAETREAWDNKPRVP